MIRWAVVLTLLAAPLSAESILSAQFAAPTDRYAHGVLGDAVEWGRLEITTDGIDARALAGDAVRRRNVYGIRLPLDRVFEDLAPRLVDVDGDSEAEVIVVETQVHIGAQLAIYDETGKIAATPHIGQRNRWLAPIGAADLDGDGYVEIAYIDRPHLAKTLTVWRYVDGELIRVTAASGLTNHRIGETNIAGGIRDCGQGPEMITANADWSRIMATRLVNGALQARDLGRHDGRNSFAAAMRCEPLPQ